MKNAHLLKSSFIFILIIFSVKISFSQARSNIGFGFGINKPYSGDYDFGLGLQVAGTIAIANQWAIVPYAAYDRINSNAALVYGPGGVPSTPIANINLYHLGLSLKYYFDRHWFVNAGSMFYMGQGGEDTVGIGVGGFGGLGYNLDLDTHSTLTFSFNTSIIKVVYNGNGVTPIAGFKVAYVLNFKGNK